MMILAFWAGSTVAYAIAYAVIQNHRTKRGYNNPSGSAIWAIWVTEALYGAGSREDWLASSAIAYVVIGFFWWAVIRFKSRKLA